MGLRCCQGRVGSQTRSERKARSAPQAVRNAGQGRMGHRPEESCASRLLMAADASPITLSSPGTAVMASPQTHVPPVCRCDHARRAANPGARTRFIVAMHLTDQCDRSFTSSLVSRANGQRLGYTLKTGSTRRCKPRIGNYERALPAKFRAVRPSVESPRRPVTAVDGCPTSAILKPQFNQRLPLRHVTPSLGCHMNLSSTIGPLEIQETCRARRCPHSRQQVSPPDG